MQSVVILFLTVKTVAAIDIHRHLVEVNGEQCMDVENVRKCRREFLFGRANVHDEERSGRPSPSDETVRAEEVDILKTTG